MQVDVDAGEVLQQIDIEAPTAAWGTDADVWVGYADGLARIDVATGQPGVVFDLAPGLAGDLAVDGDAEVVNAARLNAADAIWSVCADRAHGSHCFRGP